MKPARMLGRGIARVFPKASANLGMLAEATGHVAAHYKDLAAWQSKDTEMYVVACWLRGVNRSEFDRIKEQIESAWHQPADESNGVFSDAGVPRKTALIVMNVEAPNPHRAAARCFDALMREVEPLGINPTSVAVEADSLRTLEEGLEVETSEVPT